MHLTNLVSSVAEFFVIRKTCGHGSAGHMQGLVRNITNDGRGWRKIAAVQALSRDAVRNCLLSESQQCSSPSSACIVIYNELINMHSCKLCPL